MRCFVLSRPEPLIGHCHRRLRARESRMRSGGPLRAFLSRMSSTLFATFTSAAIASVATTAAALLLGRKEVGSAAAPLNATSHIVWGDDAANHDEVDWRHTAVGTLLNAGA